MFSKEFGYTFYLFRPTIPNKRDYFIKSIVRKRIELYTISRNESQSCLLLAFKYRRYLQLIHQTMKTRWRIEPFRRLSPKC